MTFSKIALLGFLAVVAVFLVLPLLGIVLVSAFNASAVFGIGVLVAYAVGGAWLYVDWRSRHMLARWQ